MAKSRRAHAVTFGFDFQVNAAIVLMLDNIEELKTLRLEGNQEDIDIVLDDGNHILAQAKAVEQSSYDFTLMMNILKRDFSDHQIIIASIFSYDFDDLNIIEISERLINETVQF